MTTGVEVEGDALRAKMRRFIERKVVTNSIMGVIILNALTLGLGTAMSVNNSIGGILDIIDRIVIAIFVIELLIKLFVYRLSFFRSGWNIFDLAIVAISLVPQSNHLSVLRGLRVIRSLRILSAVPQMRAVVQALIDAIPGMGAVIVMLMIVYYIFAVMATMLYGPTHPQWFGTIGESLYSLFQIMTLESWSMGIVRIVMEEHPQAWAFFVPFIITTAFAVLNLFIGLLVNTMQSAVEAEEEASAEELKEFLRNENATIRDQMSAMHNEMLALREAIGRQKGND